MSVMQIDVTYIREVVQTFSTLAKHELTGLRCQPRLTGRGTLQWAGPEGRAGQLPLKGPESVNIQQL